MVAHPVVDECRDVLGQIRPGLGSLGLDGITLDKVERIRISRTSALLRSSNPRGKLFGAKSSEFQDLLIAHSGQLGSDL